MDTGPPHEDARAGFARERRRLLGDARPPGAEDDTMVHRILKEMADSRREREMPKQSPGPSVKDPEQYEALRKQGESKEKAARIANTSRGSASKKGGKSGSYTDWSKKDLQKRAGQIGIEGRSKMSKDQLVEALRNH
jgi:hypothetical protein